MPPRTAKPAKEPFEIRYVDRPTGEIRKEVVLGDGLVRMVYERALGRALRRAVLTRPVFSRAYGRWQSSRRSTRGIGKVVSDLAIHMDDYVVPEGGFASFNDFFTRRLRTGARPLDLTEGRLLSPADGRTFAYTHVRGDSLLPAKGRHISLARLLGGAAEAEPFADGTVVIVRLCPSDYHRFHFPCDGIASPARTLPGPLESVNPLALAKGRAILDHNQRDVTMIDSPQFGRVAYVEVGAMCVGRIVQSFRPGPIKAGDEKGLFEFGGSTVILVFQAGKITIDPDLVTNTDKGLETFLKMGEGIGTAGLPPGRPSIGHPGAGSPGQQNHAEIWLRSPPQGRAPPSRTPGSPVVRRGAFCTALGPLGPNRQVGGRILVLFVTELG